MANTWTLPLALLLTTPLAAQTPGILIVHFPLASAELSAADEVALRSLCDRADIARVKGITLKGHTDLRGSVAYNEALSERRTKAVRDVLSATCLKDMPVALDWSGELEPLSDGSAEPEHAANRRVEVVMTFDDRAAKRTRALEGHPRVTPLMPGIDKAREYFACDASKAISITAGDGVTIHIPDGALVDQRGIPVKGDVQVSYRSFNEPYEIIASGIPMHIETAAGPGHFETAGMYEVYAWQGDAALSLAPGATMELERPEGSAIDPGFIGWVLDPDDGNWVPGGTLTSAPANTIVPSLLTEATGIYWNRLWRLQNEKRPDSTLFAERRQASNYCHLTACDTAASGTSWVKKRDRFANIDRVPEIHVLAYKDIQNPDRVIFTIKIEGDDDQQFPEWRRLPHKAVWEYRGPGSRAAFKRLYGRKHLFQDIDLVLEPGNDDGTLRLKENGTWLELPISAKRNRNTAREQLRWDNALALYNKALAKRSRTFDRDVQRDVARYARQHGNMPATAWKYARKAMNDLERPMELSAWVTYADTRRPPTLRASANMQRDLASVKTTFGLESFGVYNIDRIMKMAEQQNVLASTVDPEGKAFPWVNGFAVLNNENSVITYWGSGAGTGDNFLVAPGKMRSLFLVDAEGNIARADVTPLNSREPRAVLNVTRMEQPTSLDDLRAQAARYAGGE